MQEQLREFGGIPGFKGAVVFGKDGLIIEQEWADIKDADFLAASLADLINLVDQIAQARLLRKGFDLLNVEGEDYNFFVKGLDSFTYLAVFLEKKANMGLVMLELKEKINKLQEVI
ncbi:MAG: roadblock/LC7 domain-containing protein [Armatimonadota bacterium]